MLRNLRELYQYRALLYSLTQRELRARYRASVLGFLWTFLNPLLLMLVYALVFQVVMRGDITTYFLFVGLLPWLWFANSVGGGAGAISERRDLLTKVSFPPQVLPATVVASNLVNYLLALPLMVLLGLFFGKTPTWHWVLLPVLLALQLLFTLGLVYLISALNVAFRDLQHIVGNLLTLWFFLTPVLYKPTKVSAQVFKFLSDRAWLPNGWTEQHLLDLYLYLNPMAALVSSYQAIFVDQVVFQVKPLLVVLGVSVLTLFISSREFERRREEFAELV